MTLVYKDKAGNKLYITQSKIYAKNKQGKFVDKSGVRTLLKKAGKSGKIKYKDK
jgi:hypothetical protein